MWLSLFLIALLAAVTYFQAIQGLFSALITCVMTILCCAFAFAVHEYIALELLIQWKPDFALPLSLLLAFIVPLIILRTAADALIRRSTLIPSLFDHIGGGVFGFVSALLIVGMLAISVQLLPFGEPFLTHRRIEMENPDFNHGDEDAEKNIWLSPDRFAVGFASIMSNGIFSGRRKWKDDHPDFVQEVGWSQTVPSDVRCFAPRDAVRFVSSTAEDYAYVLQSETAKPDAEAKALPEHSTKRGHQFVAVRLKPQPDAQDVDTKHRFSLYQIRLVGKDKDPRSPIRHYHPVAVMDSKGSRKYVKRKEGPGTKGSVLGNLYTVDGDGNINVLFELPENFAPSFLEYKMGARARMSMPGEHTVLPEEAPVAANAADKPTPPVTPGTQSGKRSPRRRQSRGRTHGADVQTAKFTDQLPHQMTNYDTVSDAEIRNDVLYGGHIIGNLDEQGSRGGIARFEVPRGKALLRIDAVNLRAGSILGRAKSFAVKTIHNYLVADDRGKQYKVCGQIAVARIGRERIIEVQYYPEVIGTIGGVKPFSRIKDRDLKGSNYELYFLFLIDSGRKVVRFTTTGSRGGEDISDLDLDAP